MSPTLLPAADPVHWFGKSHRMIAGRPDTRYGWLNMPEGPCIVKALDLELAAYSATLLENERQVLLHLQDSDAPVPELVPCERADWLVTRFAGRSHRMLQQGAHATDEFPFAERLAALIHLLRNAQHFDEAGALPIDLWGANLVLPLTEVTHGQLRLHKGVVIDHAHTVVAGMNLRRPVWMDRDMRRVPPELRAALREDQEALIATFRAAGTPLPGHADGSSLLRERTWRLWAEYDAPQQVQRTLDDGRLDRGAAMQFAVGVELERLLLSAPARLAVALHGLIARMKAAEPAARFPSLGEAAEAAQALLAALPMVGHHHYGEIEPEQLIGADLEAAKRDETFVWPPAGAQPAASCRDATTLLSGPTAGMRPWQWPERRAHVHAGSKGTSDGMHTVPAEFTACSDDGDAHDASWMWLYALAAAGAIAGTIFPIPGW